MTMENAAASAPNTKAHILVIGVTGLCAVTCGATFLFALFRQFGLVEVAASLSGWIEVYFLSASIGDLLEDKPEPRWRRFLIGVGLAAAIVLYFVAMRLAVGHGA